MEDDVFICPLCGNTDTKYIAYRNGHPYCRKCISFIGKDVEFDERYPIDASFSLSYKLTDDQINLSNKLVDNYKKGKNTLVHAVCGAGKTEIVLEVIKYALSCGDRVGFAIPRKDVVIELCERFSSIFTKNKITYVCGGHNDRLNGDLILLTTHQLFRYEKYFDLLIMDEVDAFPYKGNEVLESFFKRALRGVFIMMSATPDEKLLDTLRNSNGEILELFSRFHMHPLPVPKLLIRNKFGLYIETVSILLQFLKKTKQVFIFTPTIDICETLFRFIHLFNKNGTYIHSKRKNRSKIIEMFRRKEYLYLVTTAVLERGVTFKDLQVIVFNADNSIYDSHSLTQIAGRVGRKLDAPDGDVYYLAKEKTNEIIKSIQEIRNANKKLLNLHEKY